MNSRKSPTIEAAGTPPARPGAAATPDNPQSSERVQLERLKREVMELRYKARRFDEIKAEFPVWRAKAHRYDTLVGALVPPALRVLVRKAQPMIERAARRRPPTPTS
ncbi:MAG TPA: hypothetical protein VGS13_15320 [Stellaceae bacterium]|nr:hypothetical protein [Stellaceae bacterium]